jgi:anti-anti-sigma regulatory factor
MSIEIKKHNHLFKVKGTLEQHNILTFEHQLKDVFETSDSITICIDDVKSIDQYGVKALTELYNQSIAKEKKLAIVGLGCKDLYEHFRTKRKQRLVNLES